MDKVELGIKLDQVKKLLEKEDYNAAAKVVDSIEWRKVKKLSELMAAEEVYEKAKRYKDARNMCVYAYNRNLGGKRLVYKLAELSILIDDLDEADELYKEFAEAAPKDSSRYVLLYKINKARKAPIERLIQILEEYKEFELEEKYEYILASLYAEAGRIEDCIRECDDLILWFTEGEYVEKALRLKMKYATLTKAQQEKYEELVGQSLFADKPLVVPEVLKEEKAPVIEEISLDEELPAIDIEESNDSEDINIPEKNYSIYDTQNIQQEIAKNMAAIMQGLEQEEPVKIETPKLFEMPETEEEPKLTEEPETETESEILEDTGEEVVEEPEVIDEQDDDITKEVIKKEELKEDLGNTKIFVLNRSAEPENEPEKPATPGDGVEEVLTMTAETIPSVVVDEISISLAEVAASKEEITENVVKQPESAPVEEPIDEVMDGQLDLLEWMEQVKASQEAELIRVREEAALLEVKTELNNRMMAAIEIAKPVKLEEHFEYAPETEAAKEVTEDTDTLEEEDSEEETSESDNSEDTEDNKEYILEPAERKYLKKYLFMNGMEQSVADILSGKKKEVPDGTSSTGNIVIFGKADIDKTNFAINLIKAIHANDDQRELKIAKTSAAAINKKGIAESLDKVKGTTLIIENAGLLTNERAEELHHFMLEQTESMLVILTGEDFLIRKLFAGNTAFAECFSYSLELKRYTVNELVAIAKEYARVKGFSIQEKALLKLYLMIGELENKDGTSEIQKVREIVDNAINECKKKGKGVFGSGKKTPLKEKHFVVKK